MAGDMLRYKRTDIDRWLLEEAELKRLAKTPFSATTIPEFDAQCFAHDEHASY